MTAFLSLLAAALIASAGGNVSTDDSLDSSPGPGTPAPTAASTRMADAAPGLVTPFESWAGLDLELVRLPGAAEPSDPSAGSA